MGSYPTLWVLNSSFVCVYVCMPFVCTVSSSWHMSLVSKIVSVSARDCASLSLNAALCVCVLVGEGAGLSSALSCVTGRVKSKEKVVDIVTRKNER